MKSVLNSFAAEYATNPTTTMDRNHNVALDGSSNTTLKSTKNSAHPLVKKFTK